MKDLLSLRYTSDSGHVAQSEAGALTFTVTMPPHKPDYSLLAEGEFASQGYFVMEYSTMGWRRPSIHRHPCINALGKNGEKVPLITCDDLLCDGRRYTVAVKMPEGDYESIRFTFCQGKRKRIDFTLHNLYTCSENELPVYCAGDVTESARDFSTVDISKHFNSTLRVKDYDVRLGGGRFFTSERVNLRNIPFQISQSERNCIAPPPPPAENDEIIENFGVKAKRRLCRPVSRDGETVIELGGKKISEIFFLMAIGGRRYQRCGFATQTTILGSYGNEVTMPLLLDDVEDFAVETVYTDGRRDLSLPMNLSCGRHAMCGDLSLYAIPANGSAVEKVIFRNRHLDNDLSLVALTVNETCDRLFPELLIPSLPEKVKHKIDSEKQITLEDHRLTLKNGAILMSFDLTKGLYLDRFENAYTPEFTFKPDSIVKIRHGNEMRSPFEAESCQVTETGATVKLRAEDLIFELTATFEGEHDILWNLNVHNPTDKPLKQGIVFPYISGAEFADRDDSWYFVPKYQNVDSNGTIYIYEESAPSFPMQFMDIYSKAQQGGLALTTRERELVVRKYALEKNDRIELYVEYPEMYGEIGAGESLICSPTLLTAHEGDWRKSFSIYKKWLDSWYEPYHCQDKQWYRECFWLLAEITDFFESEEFCRFPIWYEKDKDKFNYLDILEEQKEISGYYPDILHMWAWANRFKADGRFTQKWGNYGQSEYDDYGGLENLRSALHEFMEKKGVYSSVYLHPTLLTSFYPQFEKFKHLMVETARGKNISIHDDSFRMCHASDDWREFAIQMYPRVYSELKVPILYVDEFSLRIENRCYGKHHAHEVPSNLLKTDRNFISRLKDVMPHDVVLYGEYAAVDVNARYIDCNISYSIIDTVVDMIETAWQANDGDDSYSRVLTDIYRFAFPKIVQLNLPMAMRNLSWHPQKFTFFNGEAIYDSLWDLEESAGHEFICKAFGLKKKYADCFSSDTPETMIDTLSPAICANRFPGKGREVYTVYNRAYTTYRGKILRVKHTEGAKYYDAWNDEPLKVEIRDGYAEINLTIHAQSMGCIVISTSEEQ
ncbi:MAG: hypothetical protein IJY39_09085 [Clostridia bacterium]|nr:hypothetical protein [Clostridia bacterium]